MQPLNSTMLLPTLEQIINTAPLVVPSNTLIKEVMTSLIKEQKFPNTDSYAVVEEQGKILGILTENDVIKLAILEQDLGFLYVGDVIDKEQIILSEAHYNNIFQICILFAQYRLHHLPILNNQGELKGVVHPELILNSLKSSFIWRQSFVEEVMDSEFISITSQTSLFDIAQLMHKSKKNYLIIGEDNQLGKLITAKNIIRHQLKDFNLREIKALEVNTNLKSKVLSKDSLESARQKIVQSNWQPLLVTNAQGKSIGTLTQDSLIQYLVPEKMYNCIDKLSQEVAELKTENAKILKCQSKKTEDELQEARDQLQVVLDAMPGTISWIDSDLRYLGVNKQLANLFEKPTEAFVGKKIGSFKDNDEFGSHMERFFASSDKESSLEVKMQMGNSFNNYLVVTRKYNRNRAAVAVGVNINDLKETENALLKSAATNRAIINAIPDLIFRFNHDGVFLDYKAAKDYHLTVPPEEFLGKRVDKILPPQVSQPVLQCIESALETQEIQIFEYQLPEENNQDHTTRDWEARLFVSDENEVMAIVRDITERKRSEAMIRASLQEKEVLLKEIHHRVKNNLQVISSLFSLQSNYLEDAKTLRVLEDSQSRVKAMALIHEKIYNSQDLSKVNFAKYIQDLATYLFHAYEPNPQVELEVDIEPVSLNLDTATPCGLLISEAVSNALKYAFPNEQVGKIWIKLNYLENERMVLEIGDNGIGLSPDINLENSESLGLQLVRDLAQQIKGKLEIDCQQGTCFKIEFSELQYRRRM